MGSIRESVTARSSQSLSMYSLPSGVIQFGRDDYEVDITPMVGCSASMRAEDDRASRVNARRTDGCQILLHDRLK